MANKLRVIIFGASGMVGQGVLRECLIDEHVVEIKTIGRARISSEHPKLKQLASENLFNLESYSSELTNYDACFFSVGATAAGLNEEQYRKINYELPLAVGRLLSKLNPQMVFTYVSGTGTDSTEKGKVMWARVKGKTENDLMKLPFKGAYMFRLAGLIPKNGESSRTIWYRYLYTLTKPLHYPLQKFFPDFVTTTEELGRAMLHVAKMGKGVKIVESKEIKLLSQNA